MGKLGVGVIGCGMISGNHFHALEKLENVALRAVCDIDEEKLQKAMEAQHVDGCADWRDLISRNDIDAVHICVPHYLHAEISIAALRVLLQPRSDNAHACFCVPMREFTIFARVRLPWTERLFPSILRAK